MKPFHKISLSAITLFVGCAFGFQDTDVQVDRAVEMKTRDGVRLRADVYRPNREGRFPVLLERTPYDKRQDVAFGYEAAAAGYAVVIQDVRGRYTSEGEWYPFKHESEDGYDTVEWAASLPYSNGKVGMFGASYVGATQMLAAIAHPPHLAGICPVVTASDYHNGWTYQGGAFEQWFNESWTSGLAQDTVARAVRTHTNAMQKVWTLPLSDYPLFNFANGGLKADSLQAVAPYFSDWLAHPSYDDYWKRWSIEEHYSEINVPALTTAAWYDIFQGGSLRNYEGMAKRGSQHLLVVIGGHAGDARKVGDVDFGPAAGEYHEESVTLQWYDYLFRGVENQFAHKPVRIFVMGRNEWREENEWPPARARATRYFLHSSGNANSLLGSGVLSLDSPVASPPDRYTYDPANPVPTTGGPLCCDSAHLAPGPKDQRSVEERKDVLVYTTEPLESDLEVTGPVTAELYATSSAVDTDFTAKFVDVWPSGFAQNLTEGIVRARYRVSQSTPELLVPGKVYKFTIDLWSTSNVFRAGHRLRLEIASSNFPRFDRNLNTGRAAAFDDKYVTAVNTILHDPGHPSALALPVIPANDTFEWNGHRWTVPDASDWQITHDEPSILHLAKAREPLPGPRRPIQFALPETTELSTVNMDVDAMPLQRSLILVFAYHDAAHFDYAHLSIDPASAQPHHNGIFHVYGGERVRISAETGPAAFSATRRWYHVKLIYNGRTGKVRVAVDNKWLPALEAVDRSLPAGKVGLGSFDETADFKNFHLSDRIEK